MCANVFFLLSTLSLDSFFSTITRPSGAGERGHSQLHANWTRIGEGGIAVRARCAVGDSLELGVHKAC